MKKYIGFDVDSKKIVVCVVAEGQKDWYTTLKLDVKKVRQWLKQQRGVGDRLSLSFEVSGTSGLLYDAWYDVVDEIAVCNPSEATWIYRTRKKTDRIDAHKLATLHRLGMLPTVHMPRPAVRQWRQQIQHRRKLVQSSGQCKNRIRALVKSQGYFKPLWGRNWWTKANRRWLDELAQTENASWGMSLLHLLEQLWVYEHQIDQVTKVLDKQLARHPGWRWLRTIPGVGPRTAEAVLAYTDEVERFRRGKDYGSYFGVTPRLDESGSTRRLGHISKQGPSVVRWLIVESAWRAVCKSPALRAFYEQVCHGQVKRKKIAIVATARKMLSIMRRMLLDGEAFQEDKVSPSPRLSQVS